MVSKKEELVDLAGDMDSLFEKIISNMERLPAFLMPDGFENQFKGNDLVDLLEFLVGQEHSFDSVTIGGETVNLRTGTYHHFAFVKGPHTPKIPRHAATRLVAPPAVRQRTVARGCPSGLRHPARVNSRATP